MPEPTAQQQPVVTAASNTPRLLVGGLQAFAAILLALAVMRVAAALQSQADPYELADYTVTAATDYLIEGGFAGTKLDPDEPLLKQRTILITEAINERTARHVIARLLYLNGLDPELPIDLYITTNGGWKDSAFAMIDVMERISAPVNTIGLGGCYSAGSMLLVAGTGTRSATSNTLLSIHVYGSPEDPPPFDADPLEEKRFADLYLRRSKTPASVFEVVDESQPYFSAEQALKWGIIDQVVEPRSRRALPEEEKPAVETPKVKAGSAG